MHGLRACRLNETAMLPGVSLLNYFKLGDWYDNALIPQIGGATPGTTGYDNGEHAAERLGLLVFGRQPWHC